MEICEEHSGLHFLLEVDTVSSDEALINQAKDEGINISCLSQYYYDKNKAKEHILIINYSGVDKDSIPEAISRLYSSLW